jgi:predicted nucleic-acid-binding protein
MKSPEKVYLIDTNVILRYLLGDHPEFSPKAEAFMKDVSEGRKKAEILDVVTVECIYVLEKYYQVSKGEIVEKLSGLLNFSGIVSSNRAETLTALLKYRDTNIDIADCILAAKSSLSKVVVSFDRDVEELKAVTETL